MSTKDTAKPPLTLYTSMTLIWFFLSARFHLTCAGENWAEMTANGKRCVTPKSKSTTSSLRRQVLKRFGWMLHKCFTGRLPWANIAAAILPKQGREHIRKHFTKHFQQPDAPGHFIPPWSTWTTAAFLKSQSTNTYFDDVVQHDLELGDALRDSREVGGRLDHPKLGHLQIRKLRIQLSRCAMQEEHQFGPHLLWDVVCIELEFVSFVECRQVFLAK